MISTTNQIKQPRAIQGKDLSNIIGLNLFRKELNINTLPLCNNFITQFVKFSLKIEFKFCLVTNSLYMMNYEEIWRNIGSTQIFYFEHSYIVKQFLTLVLVAKVIWMRMVGLQS